MIRIRLTSQDIEDLRVSGTPDFGAELGFGVGMLTSARRNRRLAEWSRWVDPRRHPRTLTLMELCTASTVPGFFGETARSERSDSAPAAADIDPVQAQYYVEQHVAPSSVTPFIRAIAQGRSSALDALGRAVADFQALAIDPFRAQMTSAVAASAADTTARIARTGIGSTLRSLHPKVHWNGSTLAVGTVYEADMELDGRILLLRPSVLIDGPIVSEDLPGHLIVHIPTTGALTRPGAAQGDHRALGALLGPARAAALVAITRTPGLTTGELADVLGLSAAAASRHASVLRDAGLVTTHRAGMAVHHGPTPLAHTLISQPGRIR